MIRHNRIPRKRQSQSQPRLPVRHPSPQGLLMPFHRHHCSEDLHLPFPKDHQPLPLDNLLGASLVSLSLLGAACSVNHQRHPIQLRSSVRLPLLQSLARHRLKAHSSAPRQVPSLLVLNLRHSHQVSLPPLYQRSHLRPKPTGTTRTMRAAVKMKLIKATTSRMP